VSEQYCMNSTVWTLLYCIVEYSLFRVYSVSIPCVAHSLTITQAFCVYFSDILSIGSYKVSAIFPNIWEHISTTLLHICYNSRFLWTDKRFSTDENVLFFLCFYFLIFRFWSFLTQYLGSELITMYPNRHQVKKIIF
jgi:hypothetical protein